MLGIAIVVTLIGAAMIFISLFRKTGGSGRKPTPPMSTPELTTMKTAQDDMPTSGQEDAGTEGTEDAIDADSVVSET